MADRETSHPNFFDLEAYDRDWRYGILRDIHDIGLRGRRPSCMENFSRDRELQVRIPTTYGVSVFISIADMLP